MPTYSNESLQQKVENAPKTPGCYLFKDRMGRIVYVGKSRRLRDRVRTYFGRAAQEDDRIAGLVREIHDVAFVTTDTELDALIEEYLLIKRHRPWFNAQHIRTARPCFLNIRTDPPCPSVTLVRDMHALGTRYLGPFRDAYRAAEAIELLNRVWHTPLCGKDGWPQGARPCLYHGMGKCCAPCGGMPGHREYPFFQELTAFLEGNPQAALDRLKGIMQDAAASRRFEDASAAKEAMQRVTSLAGRIEHGFHITPTLHAILLMRGFAERTCSAFYIRQGAVRNRVRLPQDMPIADATAAFANALHTGPSDDLPPQMAACVAEISAHKRFVSLPPFEEAQGLRARFAELYARFTAS